MYALWIGAQRDAEGSAVVPATGAADVPTGEESWWWSEYKTQAQAEGTLERGPCRDVVLCALFSNSSPVAWRMAETSRVVGAGAGAGRGLP